MVKQIKLLTVNGEQEITMQANAATAVYYRRVFGDDLMREISAFAKIGEDPAAVDWELPGKLAYIMAASGAGEDMSALSEDGYIHFLEKFEGDTLWSEQLAITGVYLANQRAQSTGKK